MKNWVAIFIVLVVLVGGVILFNKTKRPDVDSSDMGAMNDDMQNGDINNRPMAGDNPVDAQSDIVTDDQNVKSFTVTGSSFMFTPKELSVNEGDTVKITFKNSDGFHDFVIDEFKVSSGRINAGGESTVTFVANKKGVYKYYCSVGSHRQMGMEGTLTVN